MNMSDRPIRPDVLVVDDTPANLDLLSSLLKEAGYSVRAALTPELGLKSAQAHPPALLLLDIRMPGMDGFEVCNRLKQDARTRAIPIIFVSGQNDVADRVRGFEVGGVDFISKPYQREEILARVRTHLALHQAHAELEQRVRERTTELEESIGQLRETGAAMDMAGIAHYRVDADSGRLLSVSDCFCQLHGYAREELIGMPITMLTANLQEYEFNELAEAFRQVGRGRFETSHLHKDGHTFFVEITFYYHPADGRAGYFVFFLSDISQRKNTEDALQRSEAKFHTLYDTNRDAVMLLDQDGFFDCNRATLQIFGMATVQEFCAATPADLSPETQPDGTDSVARAREMIATAMERGSLRFEWMHKRADTGVIFPAEVLLSAITLDGKPVLQASVRDITERKAAEERMRLDSEQQSILRQLLENTLSGASIEETLKRCLEQMLSLSWLRLLPKGAIFLSDHEQQRLQMVVSLNLSSEIQSLCAQVPYGHCLCGRAAASAEIQFAAHVDERHEIGFSGMTDHGHYNLPLTSNGQVVGVLVLYLPSGYARDAEREHFLASVSNILAGFIARKQGEQALAEHQNNLETLVHERTAELKMSEARTRAILTTMLDSVVHIDSRGIILSVNLAMQDMFGYQEEEMVGKNISMLMPEPDASEHDGYLLRYQQTRKMRVIGNRREINARHKDGHLFPVEIAVNEMADDSGSSYIGVMRDLTLQKANERTLQQAMKGAQAAAEAKSSFLANMSHEIRTPLNAVLGLAQIGLRDSNETQSRATFSRLMDAGKHLLEVVNDILDFSKIEAGKLKVEKRPFALYSVINNVKSFVAARAEEKGLSLAISVAPDISDWVEGDSLRLAQILTNLLSNAIKFTERGEVIMRIAREGDELDFMVVDSGIGMSEEQMARLFQSFEQADSSTTRNYGGTGLGLVISKKLASLMGGDISADSRPGAGSTFYLRLPLPAVATPANLGTAKPAKAAAGPRLAGISVLAADDVDLNRLLLEDILTHEGARVIFAENGREVLTRLEDRGVSAFDVVLMDVQMPVMDGLEATRRVMALAPALPVIGLTAYALGEERDKCLAAGMVEHVTKPIDVDTLVAAILRHAHAGARPAPVVQVASAAQSTPAAYDAGAAGTPAHAQLFQDCRDPGIIDLNVLVGKVGKDPAKIAKYANLYIETAHDTLNEMQNALADKNIVALSKLGHRLKPTSIVVGADRFSELCSELERMKDSNDLAAATAIVEQLQVLFAQISQCIKEAIK